MCYSLIMNRLIKTNQTITAAAMKSLVDSEIRCGCTIKESTKMEIEKRNLNDCPMKNYSIQSLLNTLVMELKFENYDADMGGHRWFFSKDYSDNKIPEIEEISFNITEDYCIDGDGMDFVCYVDNDWDGHEKEYRLKVSTNNDNTSGVFYSDLESLDTIKNWVLDLKKRQFDDKI